MVFKNRKEAAILLAKEIKKRNYLNPFILAIPRGGVIVGEIIAEELNCPLDIVVVKKIGAPQNPELAIGAVGPEGTVVWNEGICQRLGVDIETKDQEIRTKNKERREREKILRGKKPLPDLKDKTVILTDDGIATGATMEVAIKWIKTRGAAKIIVATPVAPPDSLETLGPLVNEIICLSIEPDFWAVGQFYEEFAQAEDEEVRKILRN